MLKKFQFSLYKNITKLITLCAVIFVNQLLQSETKLYASNSNITLLSDTYTIQPEENFLVGVKFELEKDWHTYWKNPGDAGEGATIEWILPEGIEASRILWPGPERIPVEPLMTFGYNNEVVLLTELSAGQDLIFPLTIQANVSWFTCKDICIPQEGVVDLVINKGNAFPSRESKELSSYFDRVPTPFIQNYRVEQLDNKYFLQADINEGKHFKSMYFFYL